MRGARRFALFAALIGAAGTPGCATSVLLDRASNEFRCPREQILVLERSDISDGLYDVDACGARARYMCFVTEELSRCTREPDPPQWNPDPALLASLPMPIRPNLEAHQARVCPHGGGVEPNDCLRFKDGTWSWYHHDSPGIMGAPPGY